VRPQHHQHLRSLHPLANQFGARIVDVSDHSVIVETSGKTTRLETFLALVKPHGTAESARTGAFFLSCSVCVWSVLIGLDQW
jgi:acetolactate synthase I/III small subunit